MTANISDVAKFFLTHVQGITHLKLQKLCYYAQAWYVARTGEPLADCSFEAWDHGPVAEELYQEFRGFGKSPIDPDVAAGFDPLNVFGLREMDVLTDVLTTYGGMSAFELRELTHQEEPWQNAYVPKGNVEITLEAMRDFYGKLEVSEMNEYDRLIQDCEEMLDDELSNGSVLFEPQGYMVEQATRDVETVQDLTKSSLEKYFEWVR